MSQRPWYNSEFLVICSYFWIDLYSLKWDETRRYDRRYALISGHMNDSKFLHPPNHSIQFHSNSFILQRQLNTFKILHCRVTLTWVEYLDTPHGSATIRTQHYCSTVPHVSFHQAGGGHWNPCQPHSSRKSWRFERSLFWEGLVTRCRRTVPSVMGSRKSHT